MPDFERMARDAEELAASVDSPTQRNTFLAIADTWRRLSIDNDLGIDTEATFSTEKKPATSEEAAG